MKTAVQYPDPILLKPADDLNFETDKPLLKELEDYAHEGFGWGNLVGLAAPQIGISKRFFMALEKMYINPTITKFSEEIYKSLEGCYSLEKGVNYPTTRHEWIILEWQDRNGRAHTKRFDGFRAQVIQHEYDHLTGKLCCQ
jgi:peptide deformylase